MKAYVERHRMDRKIVGRLHLGEGSNKIDSKIPAPGFAAASCCKLPTITMPPRWLEKGLNK